MPSNSSTKIIEGTCQASISPNKKRDIHIIIININNNFSNLEMKAVELKFLVKAKAKGHGRAHFFYSIQEAQHQKLGQGHWNRLPRNGSGTSNWICEGTECAERLQLC